MRTRELCVLGSVLFACGCATNSVPDFGTVSSLSGNWTLKSTRNIDGKAKCGCSICRKRDVLGLPPLTVNTLNIVVRNNQISAATDETGNPIAIPTHTLALNEAGVKLTLAGDLYSLPAGVYVLPATGIGYALTAENDSAASDGRVVSVSMDRS